MKTLDRAFYALSNFLKGMVIKMICGECGVLQAKKSFRIGVERDRSEYLCEILNYIEHENKLILKVESSALKNISLDFEYECRINEDKDTVSCKGNVVERYQSEEGSVVVFNIKKGIYKILT